MGKKHRVGIIGRTAGGGYGHDLDIGWLDIPGVEVVAVADEDEAGRARAAKRLGVTDTYSDYRQMLDKSKLDIVSICDRWVDKHCELTLAAMDRGLHVFMEKPFCVDLEEADKIVKASARTGLKLGIGHPTRYSPKLPALKKLIDDGKIGRILEYRARGKEDHRGGAEDLLVLGTHMMDLIQFFGGLPEWCFAEVTQEGRPITRKDVKDGPEGLGPLAGDAVSAMYGMKDGAHAYFESIRGAQDAKSFPRNGLMIYGTDGIVEIRESVMPPVKYLADPSWSPGRSGSQWQDVSSAGIGVPEPVTDPKQHARYYPALRDLIDAIENDRQPLDNAEAGRNGLEMMMATFESARLGAKVKLPLDNRRHPLSRL